ncbi:retinal pigment epithelial membrane protein-domain-containing protein [Fusarium tricinctum]|uniref:Retinal pigment epithelial membrane protein-domain-containing protein n=1 Tax=Fusarium tricinctum TaxID=61284 RepID=A0A8K0RWL1_9HYPO|nr:retinal pigment epithelial membrane protein-domain-containing protein [Fusarium tricinctum]
MVPHSANDQSPSTLDLKWLKSLIELKREENLTIAESPRSSTLAAKLDALPVGDEFQYARADAMATPLFNWPTRFDAEIASCVVHGSIPHEIDGTFYRVICDSIFSNRNGKDIWINGDGAIDAWRISNGVCDFKQKFVRTPRFILERAARKSLFGTYRNPFSGDERVFDMIQSPGNTHIHYWQGLLLATKEDSPPIAMDPDTLDTIGVYDFEGQLTSRTFTAHPKFDFATGEMMAYGIEAKGLNSNDLVYYRFNKEGMKVDECWVKTPHVSWTHDMAATDNWVIFGMTPFETDVEYMKKEAGTHFRFNRFLHNTFIVLPRRNPKPEDVRYFKSIKNHFWGHFSNYFEKDGCIYMDTFLNDGDGFGVFPNMHPELDAGKPKRPIQGKFVRFKIDPKSPSDYMELPVVLSEVLGEMARSDDRYQTKPYNHAYAATPGDMGFNGVLHVNHATGESKVWRAGDGVTVGEPCFVPRNITAPEGDGYLVVCIRDAKTTLAYLAILDALEITSGPIGIVELPFRLREGVHGSWVNASDRADRQPLVDYSGVTPEILEEYGTGAPKPYDKLPDTHVKISL